MPSLSGAVFDRRLLPGCIPVDSNSTPTGQAPAPRRPRFDHIGRGDFDRAAACLTMSASANSTISAAPDSTIPPPSKFDQTAFDQSAFDLLEFDQSAFDRSAFDQSALDQSALDQSAFDQSTFDRRVFDQSAFGQTAADRPSKFSRRR